MKETFYDYITQENTEYIRLYKKTFNSSIDLLPRKVCSSKAIINILRKNTNYFDIEKNIIFKNCFMEYFEWKVLDDLETPIR